MAQVSMTVRMDSRLKTAFDALCQQFGMSAKYPLKSKRLLKVIP